MPFYNVCTIFFIYRLQSFTVRLIILLRIIYESLKNNNIKRYYVYIL